MSRSFKQAAMAAFGFAFILSGLCLIFAAHSPKPTGIEQANVDGKALYAGECATCHGKDGKAKTFKAKLNHARNLTDAGWQAEVTEERLFNSIHNGKGKMPGFGKKLTDTQINALVAFVRTLKQ